MKKKNIRAFFLGMLVTIGVSSFPSIFMLCQNIGESKLGEIVAPLIISNAVGLTVLFLSAWAFKSLSCGAIYTSVVMITFLNYKYIAEILHKVLPAAKYWHIAPAVITVLLVLFVSFLNLSSKVKDKMSDVALAVAISVIGMSFVNIIPAVVKAATLPQTSKLQEYGADHSSGSQQNIYWIILDECADFQTMERYYDYSGPYQRSLEDLGFTISDSSYNDARYTDVVLTNCICLDFVVNASMEFPAMKPLREEGMLYKLMRNCGYSFRGIGNTEWLGVLSVTMQGESKGSTISGETIDTLIAQNTIIAPFMQKKSIAEKKVILDTISFLKDLENFTENNSVFNLVYLLSPHTPFLFDSSGNDVSVANYSNWEDKQYYRNQYIYIMKEVVEAIQGIIEKDPDCIIVLGSDHGPRQVPGMLDSREAQRVLLAVYDGGKDASWCKNKATVNVLRKIVGDATKIDLPELEVPYYE